MRNVRTKRAGISSSQAASPGPNVRTRPRCHRATRPASASRAHRTAPGVFGGEAREHRPDHAARRSPPGGEIDHRHARPEVGAIIDDTKKQQDIRLHARSRSTAGRIKEVPAGQPGLDEAWHGATAA